MDDPPDDEGLCCSTPGSFDSPVVCNDSSVIIQSPTIQWVAAAVHSSLHSHIITTPSPTSPPLRAGGRRRSATSSAASIVSNGLDRMRTSRENSVAFPTFKQSRCVPDYPTEQLKSPAQCHQHQPVLPPVAPPTQQQQPRHKQLQQLPPLPMTPQRPIPQQQPLRLPQLQEQRQLQQVQEDQPCCQCCRRTDGILPASTSVQQGLVVSQLSSNGAVLSDDVSNNNVQLPIPLSQTAFSETVRYMKYRAFLRWYKGAHEASWSRGFAVLMTLVAGALVLFAHYSMCTSYVARTDVFGIYIGAMAAVGLLLLLSSTLFLPKWSIRVAWTYILGSVVILILVNLTAISGSAIQNDNSSSKELLFMIGTRDLLSLPKLSPYRLQLEDAISNQLHFVEPHSTFVMPREGLVTGAAKGTLNVEQCDNLFWLPLSYVILQGLLVTASFFYSLVLGRLAKLYFMNSRLFIDPWTVVKCEPVQLLVPALGEVGRQRYNAMLAGEDIAESSRLDDDSRDRLRVSWGLRIDCVHATRLGSRIYEGLCCGWFCRRRLRGVDAMREPSRVGCWRVKGKDRQKMASNHPHHHHNAVVSYIGETSPDQKPDGFGFWKDTNSDYGERLVGYWTQGSPNGPHKSREAGTGSGFMCLRIGWAKFTLNEDSLKFGIANVECSVSGKFYRGYPHVKLMWPSEQNNPLSALNIRRFMFDLDPQKHGGPAERGLGEAQARRQANLNTTLEDQCTGALEHPPQRSYSAFEAAAVATRPGMNYSRYGSLGRETPDNEVDRRTIALLKRTAKAAAPAANFLRKLRKRDIEKIARLHRAHRDVAWCLAELSPHTPNFGIQPRSELVITVDAERGVYISGYVPQGNFAEDSAQIFSLAEEVGSLKDDTPGHQLFTTEPVHSQLPPSTGSSVSNRREDKTADARLAQVAAPSPRNVWSPNRQGSASQPAASKQHRWPSLPFLRIRDTPWPPVAPPQPSAESSQPHTPFYRKPTVEKEVHNMNAEEVMIRVVRRKLMAGTSQTQKTEENCSCACHATSLILHNPADLEPTVASTTVPNSTSPSQRPTAPNGIAPQHPPTKAAASPKEFESPELQADGWVSMDAAGSPEVLLYIHGYNNSHEESLQVLGQMAAFGNYPNHIRLFLFSWPAGRGFWQFFKAQKAAEDNRTHQGLKDLLLALRDNGIRQIHVMCHSMGARLFLRSFRKLCHQLFNRVEVDGGEAPCSNPSSPPKGRMQLVSVTFLNPEYFLKEFVCEDYPLLRSFCNHISIFADSRDQALWWSETLSRTPALGKTVFGLWRPAATSASRGPSQMSFQRAPPKFMNTVSFFHLNSEPASRKPHDLRATEVADAHDIEWLDLDVIDTTFMDQNVHAMRHTFWNLNREIIEDIRELMVTRKRARQRIGRLDRRERNVWVYRVAPSFLTSLWDISI